VVQYRKLQPVQFRTTRHFSFHQRHSETEWHNITCSGPSCIARKLCSSICWRNLPQRNRSESTNVDVQAKNKIKHVHHTIKHATTSESFWSPPNCLLYIEWQQSSTFCNYSADKYYLSDSRAMVQFMKWSNLRGLPLHCLSYFFPILSLLTFCLLH
jgi:hypothetical protein